MTAETKEGIDQTGPVTISIARKIVSGREAEYEEWLKKLTGIVEGEEEVRKGTGLEFWFSLPELPVAHPSPHKMALVLLVVVFVLVLAVRSVLSTFASDWPMVAQLSVTVSQMRFSRSAKPIRLQGTYQRIRKLGVSLGVDVRAVTTQVTQ